jgi:hypothetical protein
MPNRQRFRPAKEDILSRAAGVPKNLAYTEKDADYGVLMMFRDYKYQRSSERGFSQIGGAESNVTDTIFLPLPTNIADQFQVRVQRFDQGSTGDVVSSLLSEIDINDLGVGSLTGAVLKGAMKNLPGLKGNSLDEIAGNLSKDLAFLVRKGVDSAFPNQGRNVDAGTGTFINPKAALSFEGVEMKVHTFAWTIAPKTEEESENLRKISQTIKKNMLPSYVDTAAIQRAMFRYPSMVDVFFVGLNMEYYYYFKTCMIQTFNTNFTPNGVSVLRGGKPAMVQMDMAMIETDIHTAEDYGGESSFIRNNAQGAFDRTG